ncbi:MAG: hypothetical protein WCI71_11640, partial [Bacteroidota bacterium]
GNCGTSLVTILTSSTTLNPPAAPVAGTHVPNYNQIVWNWTAVSGATGYKWNTTNDSVNATKIGAATSKTESGLTCNHAYTRYLWAYGNCGTSLVTILTSSTTLNAPAAPVAGVHVPTYNQIVWNWNIVPGANGYKWSTNNDSLTAITLGPTITSRTETGLLCNHAYTRYLWAYGNCGTSLVTILTSSTTLNPPAAPVAGVHVPSYDQIVWNWNIVPGANGYKWSTTNDSLTAITLGPTITSRTETGLLCNHAYTRYLWAYGNCGTSFVTILTSSTTLNPPTAPVAGVHVPSYDQIVWNWNVVPGANGYKWSSTNDSLTAITLGPTITSRTETGLLCNHAYTRYLWAYGNCGTSLVTILTSSTTLNPPAAPVAGVHVPSYDQIVWNWNIVPGANGYKWSTTNDSLTAITLGPTLTSRTETGLLCNHAYTRYLWAYGNCGTSLVTILTSSTTLNPPAAPVPGIHISYPTQITWNWNAVPEATGYKWNTVNDTTGALNMGTNLTKTESGLTCSTPFSRYVWAYNNCGTSSAVLMKDTTLWCCGKPIKTVVMQRPTIRF